MTEAEEFRRLAQVCRERASLRTRIEDQKLMLGVAAEFERMAQRASSTPETAIKKVPAD